MIDFLIEGGLLFTMTLTTLLLANILLIARNLSFIYTNKSKSSLDAMMWINYVKYLGILALTISILGQLIGLYSAFEAIEKMGDIPPNLLAGGLRVSSITTLYGFGIFVFSYFVWMLLKIKANDYEKV